ncbi:hypothetical protein MN116_002865 [Schistosoma mekongi]|uniref:Uncharacterized protein n=1 Tax=Schistosoma mekongi TaxID=38744 RepID=A0AAE2D700_SCHME|nr:hypothetical protein MN116_002865 [Schistosoma mekongi]
MENTLITILSSFIDIINVARQRDKYLDNNENMSYDFFYDKMAINYGAPLVVVLVNLNLSTSDLLHGPYKNCTFQPEYFELYPECLSKIEVQVHLLPLRKIHRAHNQAI